MSIYFMVLALGLETLGGCEKNASANFTYNISGFLPVISRSSPCRNLGSYGTVKKVVD